MSGDATRPVEGIKYDVPDNLATSPRGANDADVYSETTGILRRRRDLNTIPKSYVTEGFGSTLYSYWNSFKSSMNGLYQTPRAMKEETQYFMRNPSVLLHEILCGLSMSVIVMPESISFAYMIDMTPTQGLYTTFFVCLATAIFGARPAMISGAAGSICAVLQGLTESSGPLGDLPLSQRHEAVLLTTFFVAIIQFLTSFFRLSQYSKLLSHSTMIGFINALGYLVFSAQFHAFKICSPPESDPNTYKYSECPTDYVRHIQTSDRAFWPFVCIFVVSFLIVWLFPRIPRVGKIIPSTLIALIVGTVLEHVVFRPIDAGTRTLDDTAPLVAEWPQWHFPSVQSNALVSNSTIWYNVLAYAVYTSFVGTIESIATVQAMNERLSEKSTDQQLNTETFAQGIGNLLCSVFTGFGGCGILGEAVLNLYNGARHRVSTFVTAWTVMFIVLWVSPLVNLIPISALAATIMFVAIQTFIWPSLRIIWTMRKNDFLCVVVVTLVAIFTNLFIAMIVGYFISSTTKVLDDAKKFKCTHADYRLKVQITDADNEFYYYNPESLEEYIDFTQQVSSYHDDEEVSANNTIVRVYTLSGRIFFGSSNDLKNIFHPSEDPLYIIFDFADCDVEDFSATNALEYTLKKYSEEGRYVKFINVNAKAERQFVRNDYLLYYVSKVDHRGVFRMRSKEERDKVEGHDSLYSKLKGCVTKKNTTQYLHTSDEPHEEPHDQHGVGIGGGGGGDDDAEGLRRDTSTVELGGVDLTHAQAAV